MGSLAKITRNGVSNEISVEQCSPDNTDVWIRDRLGIDQSALESYLRIIF